MANNTFEEDIKKAIALSLKVQNVRDKEEPSGGVDEYMYDIEETEDNTEVQEEVVQEEVVKPKERKPPAEALVNVSDTPPRPGMQLKTFIKEGWVCRKWV